jgi:hypothetical protein
MAGGNSPPGSRLAICVPGCECAKVDLWILLGAEPAQYPTQKGVDMVSAALIILAIGWLAWRIYRWEMDWRPIGGKGWGGPSTPEELANDNSYLPPEILDMPLTGADLDKLMKGQKVYFK